MNRRKFLKRTIAATVAAPVVGFVGKQVEPTAKVIDLRGATDDQIGRYRYCVRATGIDGFGFIEWEKV